MARMHKVESVKLFVQWLQEIVGDPKTTGRVVTIQVVDEMGRPFSLDKKVLPANTFCLENVPEWRQHKRLRHY